MVGFQGRINIYTCRDCGGQLVTVDRDDGTTPFLTKCRTRVGCNGVAQSALYRADQTLRPTHEWYRPTVVQHLRPGERQHVDKGGLLLRRIDQGDLPE